MYRRVVVFRNIVELHSDASGAWTFRATPRLCSGLGILFGGITVGAVATAVEETRGKAVAFMNARFLRPVRADDDVRVLVGTTDGATSSRCEAEARVADDVVLHMDCRLAGGELADRVFAVRASAPPPEDCAPRDYALPPAGTVAELLDVRVSPTSAPAAGFVVMWARLAGLGADDAGSLAVLADHVPYAIRLTTPEVRRLRTVASTLHVLGHCVSDWVQLDVTVDAVAAGLAHGSVRMWAPDGRLVATSAQTIAID
jgi:acyl-CoA thioesterase